VLYLHRIGVAESFLVSAYIYYRCVISGQRWEMERAASVYGLIAMTWRSRYDSTVAPSKAERSFVVEDQVAGATPNGHDNDTQHHWGLSFITRHRLRNNASDVVPLRHDQPGQAAQRSAPHPRTWSRERGPTKPA
jgi:hypothetical protein